MPPPRHIRESGLYRRIPCGEHSEEYVHLAHLPSSLPMWSRCAESAAAPACHAIAHPTLKSPALGPQGHCQYFALWLNSTLEEILTSVVNFHLHYPKSTIKWVVINTVVLQEMWGQEKGLKIEKFPSSLRHSVQERMFQGELLPFRDE